MHIYNYLFVAAVLIFAMGFVALVYSIRKEKPHKSTVNLLKQMRLEAIGRLRFEGSWSGYWTTSIMGIDYRSDLVSGVKYLQDDCGHFIQNAIIDRCKLLRNKDADADARQLSHYGRQRIVQENGRAYLY